jgi:hypothetical protein
MPKAEISSKQALHTLTQLHAELAGKIETNRNQGDKLRAQMVQVEAVIKMLAPDFSVAGIAAKRRNKSNPWFKRGTLFRSAVDVMRRAGTPMTARDIAQALLADKAPQATRKQALDLQAAILVALRKRNGGAVIGEGAPARWRLKEAAN